MLEIKSLSVAYGECEVLKDINLKVTRGEVLALIGPNGAGKSTLIRTISGVLPRRAGQVLINGQDILKFSDIKRAQHVAVVPQARELPGAYTVNQTVSFGRTPYLGWLGRPGRKDHELVAKALDLVQISDLAERQVGKLSGGEQQLVLLARALAQEAPLLLLDEPTTHLDLEHEAVLLNLVRKLSREKILAVIMVLHDLNHAALYADKIALLNHGEVKVCGAPDEVLTEENIKAAYHVPVQIIQHPVYGTPLILPDGVSKVVESNIPIGSWS